MADETMDAGLEELTADILGPADGAQETATTEQATTESAVPEPEAPAQPEVASGSPPPTPPPAAVPTVEVNGKQYTLEQLEAALQTREQFPGLQAKYVALKRDAEARAAEEAQRAAQGAPASPQQVLSAMRSSFDPEVKKLVEQGFIEEDLAALYPNAMAGVAMMQQSLVSVSRIVEQQAQKIAMYEREITSERTEHELRNNMVALSSQHEMLAPLAQRQEQDEFLQYLWHLNPQRPQLEDRDFWVRQYVAFRKDTILAARTGAAPTPTPANNPDARRRARGAPMPGSRAAALPEGPMDPLQELVTDELARRAGR